MVPLEGYVKYETHTISESAGLKLLTFLEAYRKIKLKI